MDEIDRARREKVVFVNEEFFWVIEQTVDGNGWDVLYWVKGNTPKYKVESILEIQHPDSQEYPQFYRIRKIQKRFAKLV